jgi:hypothetical protein
MYEKDFCYAQQFIEKVTSFDPFLGHHQACISEPTNVPGQFRAIVRTVYQNPRMFRAIFGPSSDLYIRTHECSGPFSGHHHTCISEPTNVLGNFRAIVRTVYQNPRMFRAILGSLSDLYIRTHECSGPFSGHRQTCISEPINESFGPFSGYRQTWISKPMKESSGPFSAHRQTCIPELMKETETDRK